jgi:hypothetical protein
MRGFEFLDRLSDYQLSKEYPLSPATHALVELGIRYKNGLVPHISHSRTPLYRVSLSTPALRVCTSLLCDKPVALGDTIKRTPVLHSFYRMCSMIVC